LDTLRIHDSRKFTREINWPEASGRFPCGGDCLGIEEDGRKELRGERIPQIGRLFLIFFCGAGD
jgi:hypothetical protein